MKYSLYSKKNLMYEVKKMCNNCKDEWYCLDYLALREYMTGNKLIPLNIILWRLQKKFFGFVL